MIIIAEKLNGSIPSCAKAIEARDEDYIRDMAERQSEARADFIDVCASVNEGEAETMKWMIDLVQEACDTRISIDSPNPRVLAEVMQYCKRPGLVNSVSGEGDKMDVIFPAIADTKWSVMALLCDDRGIPEDAEGRIEVLENIMARAKEFGIADDRIYIDPMVEMVCTSEDGISVVLEVIRYVKKHYPKVHVSCAVSNISFNLPVRKHLNQAFTVLAMNAGMDSAVLDPLSRDLMGVIFATDCMLGEDYYCLEYIGAYRDDLFGPKK